MGYQDQTAVLAYLQVQVIKRYVTFAYSALGFFFARSFRACAI